MTHFGFARSFCRLIFIALLAASSALTHRATAKASGAAPGFADQTSAFLKKYVAADGTVGYAAIQRNPAELKALLKRIETFEAKKAPAAERKAFYLNAYNLLVIAAVVERYPTTSVMKLPGFFDTQRHKVAGENMTLNGLEANKLMRAYNDPRVHFALVCAAKGCPKLTPEAYRAERLEDQLTERARQVLRDPQFIRRDDAAGKVLLSEIFKWYAGDFKAAGKTAVGYINRFLAQPIPASYKVDYYPYDWSLNE
ncbi:DUF547 domain-containing protein [Hymenobacter busanensis]|uniref:DUF547 domain-containing protein n=1 Tax=Hymenobacter busanensis TaxID=2607656 RepID=A0A7L4ZWQ7_9BACT|nr:DUF547 domain-containing protein [Hymenobacter busanensis]KAA9339603.1 DUF547 domain-containing protein [Hymenobacter busanensis]QHJ06642.1 DUF547 domain-containing protein [Hymenobacter busanensis]